MKTIKAKVHRLPTEDKSCKLHRMKDKGHLLYGEKDPNEEPYANLESFYLYITTDEEIKEGDWIFETDLNTINQAGKDYNFGFGIKHDRKIIATTDSLLSHVDVLDHHYLPWIPQSFIEDYCKAGGIDEVLVEMALDTHREGRYAGHLNGEVILHIKPDNSIIIHPVEEKKVSEVELKILAAKLIQLPFDEKMRITESVEAFDKWIEENL